MESWTETDFLWQRRSFYTPYTYQSDVNPDNYTDGVVRTYVANYFLVNTWTPSFSLEWIDIIKAGPCGTCLKVHYESTSFVDDIIPNPPFRRSLTSLISAFFNPHLLRGWKLPSSSPQASTETVRCLGREEKTYHWSLIKLRLWRRALASSSLRSPQLTVQRLWKSEAFVSWRLRTCTKWTFTCHV